MASWAITVGHWRRVPIKLHATLPLGLFFFSGFRFAPAEWGCTLALILIHELGHAWVVRAVGGRSTEVMIHGFGGWCVWIGEVSPLGRAAIACGGVAAQLVLLIATLITGALGVWPEGNAATIVFWALTISNAWMIGFNLLPFRPLDGAEAWAFPYLLGKAARRRLTVHRNVAKVDGDFVATGEGGVKDQARDLAAQLLAEARKPGDEP
jgi:Zn-dependent protease